MRKLRLLSLSLILTIFTFGGLTAFADSSAYPNKGIYPTPMGDKSSFHFFLTENLNSDGTSKTNAVVDAAAEPYFFNGVNYLLKKLDHDDSIMFTDDNNNTNTYVVYSVIPQEMSISYAYKHLANYYDLSEESILKLPPQVNGVSTLQISQLNSHIEFTQVPGGDLSSDKDLPSNQVRTIQSGFFLPNLPNGQNDHNGLTENVYWTIDPWLGDKRAKPQGSKIHMIPYGWALDATADQAIVFQYVATDGGLPNNGLDKTINQPAAPFNYWSDLLSMSTNQIDSIPSNSWTGYPFPRLTWVPKGVYMPYQPMPGFQMNLIRWYTPWGTWNLLNNTSGLFVRQTGEVEFPVDQNNQPYPLVVQTWDGSQRFTVINKADDAIPSTQDQYPGNEYYFASNVFLPNKAGVVTSYKDYRIYDGTGKLNPRQSDIWLGLKGDSIKNVMVWDDADGSEPGGQANKPYMMGADVSVNPDNGFTYYNFRLSHSNSFMIATLPHAQDENKLYSTSLYVAQ
ncbi:MAG: hypothetical protein WBE18_03335, partial [Gammaproteobacteria bacterium]